MKIDDDTRRAIEENADLVLSLAREQLEQDIGFDERGVRWLNGFVQRHHERGNPDEREKLVSTLGSYLGKCVIETYGGVWADVHGMPCVQFDERNSVSPFAKIGKQLENGSEDSCLSFFTLIPILFKHVLVK